jgi:hypothetical protein
VGLGSVAAIVVIGFSQLGAVATLVSVACLALPAAFIVLDQRMPPAFALIFVVAANLSAAGWAWNLYRIPHFDGLVHIVATLAITLFFACYIYGAFLRTYRGHPWLLTVTLLSIGTAIGAGWEIIEYFFIPAAKMGLYDTVTDLLMDFIGAAFSVPLVRREQSGAKA